MKSKNYKTLQWNKWSKNNSVPFDKNESLKKIKYNVLAQHVGHGELKFAKEVSGSINPTNMYDVDSLDNKKWEVKQIDCSKNSFTFRKTILPNTSLAKFKSEIGEISKQLFNAFCYLNKNQLQLVQKYIQWEDGIDNLVTRIREIHESIVRGNIGRYIIFGNKKRSIVGLKQIITHISNKIKKFSKKTIVLKINGKNYQITAGQLILIKKVIGIEKIKNSELIDFMRSNFLNKVFNNIKHIDNIWNSVNCKETLLNYADNIVIVDEKKGFFPISSDSVNKYIRFVRTSGKDASFEFLIK